MSAPRPLRILLYTPVVPTETGGVQAVYRRTADALAARGHAVVRAWPIEDPDLPADARCGPGAGGGPWPRPGGVRTLRLPRLEDRRLPLGGFRPTPGGLRAALDPLRRLAGVLVGFRPDVADVHFPRGGTRWLARARRCPGLRPHALVLTCHGSDLLRPLPADARRLAGLLAAADRVIAVSADLAAKAEAYRMTAAFHPPGSAGTTPAVDCIENGVDLGFWARPSGGSGGGSPPEPRHAVSVGRLERVKGHDVLLHAFARVVRAFPDARLTLVGDGPEEAALRALAAGLDLTGAVAFAGRLPPEATRSALHRAGVFALPSRSEGLPLALLEAMAAGLAPVASAVGGVPAAIGDPPAGLIVPPEDAAALADRLAALFGDEPERARLAAAAADRSASHSAAASDRRHAEVLEEAAEAGRGRRGG